ncbi:bifunctional 3-dehydroquinate dehydratase/shikimate dehydrogenase, chloroplastic isoform X2 [Elaeis guineensis]|uniref:shikimate dehydrogenase (NADP(+)) n=1 Tax=Elaeis guineensis var. tenera TaxID=51953 RepID=A0A6I9QS58_ELAGV|nr:bifunctional 3-dehydroquinate dehydratase/shikimate dehydrogenase, chloroplastic [Elaeis guineensis]
MAMEGSTLPPVAKTVKQMAADMDAAKAAGADLVEIRLAQPSAFRPQEDLEFLLKGRPLPALVTYRPKWEGGEYEGDDNQRFEALHTAVDLGAEHVDIELKVAEEFVRLISGKKPENFKLIVSSHNYQSTPSSEELGSLAARTQAVGADIVKVVTTAVDIVDVTRMFQLIVHCQEKQVPMIGFVMGERGVISQLLCPKFGGYLTFGALDAGKESAPRQPTLSDLLNVYNIRKIRADTKVYGLIGKPVGQSKRPILHNAAFKSVGFNAVYVPLLVDDLANFLSAYCSPDFAGFSCTLPYKETAVTCCDEIDPIAKSIGAINTIIRRPADGKLVGYNTDYIGAISAIEDGIRGSWAKDAVVSPLAGKLFVVIGAGGAGKALAYGATEKGARVAIANRTYERARELANLIGGHALTLAELERFHPKEGMILANTTSVGMRPNVNDTPVSKQALRSYAVVFDAVYTPKVIRLLREAKESGAAVVSGVEMFIRQAMRQFELFTGLAAPEGLMRNITSSL